MNEMTNNMNTQMFKGVHAGNTQGTGGDYYHTYYRELVSRGARRAERNRHLEAIKMGRRRARREKWLKGIKSLASVLISSEAVS